MRKNLLSRAHTHTLLEEERKKQFWINNKKTQINVKIIYWILSTTKYITFSKDTC